MGWPFTSVVEPNLNIGPTDVPDTPAEITPNQTWLLGAHFRNNGGVSRTILVVDGAGGILCNMKLPANAEQPYEWAFRPALGVTWGADGAGVEGQIWGYE